MMRNRFDQQLEQLHADLITMGGLCETAIAAAVDAATKGDGDMAKAAIADDSKIDEMERSIEHLCLKLLLQQQPVARDLRQISAALKMITDMERIGDQAEDICEIIPFLKGRSGQACGDIDKMAAATIKMVTDSVSAFVRKDTELAERVIAYDDVVDDFFEKVKNDLITMITQNPQDGEYALDLLMIAKYFERIGDHAVNIAEWVAFAVTGIHKEEEQ